MQPRTHLSVHQGVLRDCHMGIGPDQERLPALRAGGGNEENLNMIEEERMTGVNDCLVIKVKRKEGIADILVD